LNLIAEDVYQAAPLYAECSLILDGFDEPFSGTKKIHVIALTAVRETSCDPFQNLSES
jgi:hypothetical protein